MVSEEPKGLGDVIASITKTLGIDSCEPCEARRKFLNYFTQHPEKFVEYLKDRFRAR